MRLRSLLIGLIFGALLLALPGLAVSSASDYRASEASLRALWATDINAGVSPSQLAPLTTQLDAADSSTLASLATITFNPSRSIGLLTSLRTQTDAIYATDLTNSRADALAERTALNLALAPATSTQMAQERQVLSDASTPADYAALAVAWRLDTLLVPLDRSMAAHAVTLKGLVTQANSLALATPAADESIAAIGHYFTLDPSARYAVAPSLLTSADTVLPRLQAQINSELAARAAAAKAAADAVAAQARAAAAASYAAAHAGLYLYLNGYYSDCTGHTLLSAGLYRDTCIHTTTYLLSHAWSIGASFLSLDVGSVIYYQGHRYTVTSRTIVTPAAEEQHLKGEARATNVPPLTLQTCWTASGSLFLIIEAR